MVATMMTMVATIEVGAMICLIAAGVDEAERLFSPRAAVGAAVVAEEEAPMVGVALVVVASAALAVEALAAVELEAVGNLNLVFNYAHE